MTELAQLLGGIVPCVVGILVLALLVGFLLVDVDVTMVTVYMTIPVAGLAAWVLATGRLAPMPDADGVIGAEEVAASSVSSSPSVLGSLE